MTLRPDEVRASVVIPVYNAELYLERCLDSVRAQTIRDIEIICVDDGSTDRSAAMLERYARLDPRIRVIRQQNEFAGAARNKGLADARGTFVYFMDSDDYISPLLL